MSAKRHPPDACERRTRESVKRLTTPCALPLKGTPMATGPEALDFPQFHGGSEAFSLEESCEECSRRRSIRFRPVSREGEGDHRARGRTHLAPRQFAPKRAQRSARRR